MTLRTATPADFPALLRLNEDNVHFLSAMEAPRLQVLHAQACHHRVVEEGGFIAGFLLAFREASAYDSVNYRWFAQRYDSFLYIDRVVVDARFRGRGVARRLYEDAFAAARALSIPRVTCEFDVEPPNPVSARLHASFGFSEVGRQRVDYAAKTVSLQAAQP